MAGSPEAFRPDIAKKAKEDYYKRREIIASDLTDEEYEIATGYKISKLPKSPVLEYPHARVTRG